MFGVFILIIYFVIPFILFLLLQFAYIKLGLYISKNHIPSIALKRLFLCSYLSFGVLIVYTNLIWSVKEEPDKYVDQRYAAYDKYYANSDLVSKYKKISISGDVDPQLNVSFAVTLLNTTKGCHSLSTTSTQGEGWYKNTETVVYPIIKPGQYSIDIYLENYKKDTDCKFFIKDAINVGVYGNNLKHGFHSAKLTRKPEKYNDFRIIGHEIATIVCKDRFSNGKRLSECDNVNDPRSADFSLDNTKHVRLDFTTDGQISGNTRYIGNSLLPDFLKDTFKKFLIGEGIPSYDPR